MTSSLQPPVLTTKNGQSLLEAIAALAVAMLVILALVWVTIVSIRNADFAKKQSQAAKYAQEGMENMRALRDSNWSSFWAMATGSNYCFSGSAPAGNCSTGCPSLGGVFRRCAKIEAVDSTPGKERAKVTVTVSWTDSSGTHKSEQISYFTKWQ